MLKSTWFLILLAPCMAQQTQGGGTGVITGTLTGEDGTPIIGGIRDLAVCESAVRDGPSTASIDMECA